jgi:hypothetical protein
MMEKMENNVRQKTTMKGYKKAGLTSVVIHRPLDPLFWGGGREEEGWSVME